MPSDAFLELSPYGELMGESGDEMYGASTPYQMVEISSLDFAPEGTQTVIDPSTGQKTTVHTAKKGDAQKGQGHTTDAATDKPKIKVTKAIDYCSPDLFQYFCQRDPTTGERKPIKWAIITVRESGEDPGGGERTPWLRIELQDVHVVEFSWSLDPDAAGEEALKTETVTFDFNTMLVSYYPQDPTGKHLQPARTKGWNFKENNDHVSPIS